ncbi:hypothetical protein [Methylomicrobium lacus]|uniref:hypothetical protein n=1 Tax=Methylomicrobium lacus TaxID=136992 RepID=UPI0035A8CEC9
MQVNLKTQPGVSNQFRYDGMGRRTAIIATNGTTTKTGYLWHCDKLCQSRTATDTVSRRYYPEGEFSPPNGTGLYYSQDHLGSVRDVLNIQTGLEVVAQLRHLWLAYSKRRDDGDCIALGSFCVEFSHLLCHLSCFGTFRGREKYRFF